MGKRQDYLKEICLRKFGKGSHKRPSRNEILESNFLNTIKIAYKQLNGQFETPPTRIGPWDINTKDFIIELDEERHFNRYRLLTLKSEFYKNWDLFNVEKYKEFCVKYEQKCLETAGWAGNWKNNSTEKQFGKSNAEKNLTENGSSRWKQRAYYDFVKDISSLIIKIPIIRISIYEKIDSFMIDELIKQKKEETIVKYIENRIKNIG